jgi:hypothetical protein
MASISPRMTAAWLIAGTAALFSAAIYYAWPSRTTSGLGGIASSLGTTGIPDDAATLRALEQRVKVLEDIVAKRGDRRMRPAGFRQDTDNARESLVSANGKDIVGEKLNVAMALQSKFDKEAGGIQSKKALQAQGTIYNAFNEITKVEPRYAPAWAAQPECHSTMCRLQYRYHDESVAEYASTALLMELNSSFRSADVITLPNNDGTYDLLIFGRLK